MKCPHCGRDIDVVLLKGHVNSDIPDPTDRNADKAIELYYRRKAQGMRRVTLKRIAEETGFSHSWLRQVKVAYDRAGKWGSKP